MNVYRFARAMGAFPTDLIPFPPYRWPVNRCAICGRIEKHYAQDGMLYYALVDDRPRLICRDHLFSQEHQEDYDCCTGVRVSLLPPKPFIEKQAENLRIEMWFWLTVILKYIWYTITTWFTYITHPIKAIKMIRFYKKFGMDWK